MDNLTHTLIGAIAAEVASRIVPVTRSVLPQTTRRNLYMSLMVVGGNLPDMDIAYSGMIDGSLGYLLHHRGHTHTLVGVAVLAVMLYVAVIAWLRWRRLPVTQTDNGWLALIAMLAPLLHLGMDATNEYGVHPYWPFNNEWFYGDAVFIVEPLFWAAAAPLVFLLRSPSARGLMVVVLFLAVGLGFGSGLVPRPMASGMVLLIAGLLAAAWRLSARTAASSGLAAMIVIVAVFVVAGNSASRQVSEFAKAQYPAAVVEDLVLAPLPVNPVCWEIILVQLQGDEYTLREGMLSLAPGWMAAAECSRFAPQADKTAELTPIMSTKNAALELNAEMTMSLRDMQTLVRANCEAAAFTRFARALWFMRAGRGWLIGDLRYDREPEPGFAELVLSDEAAQCPANIPPWVPPRSDVLGDAVDDI